MRITSTHNPLVRYVRSLTRAQTRRQEHAFLVEGVRLVAEAMSTSQTALLALYDPDALARTEAGTALIDRVGAWAAHSYEVAPHVVAAVSQTETPSGIVAVLRLPPGDAPLALAGARLVLILDRLADPGNAGTILRTAAALGAEHIVTLPLSIDLYAPKVVRAGMGAHFRVPISTHVPWPEVRAACAGSTVVAMAAGRGSPLDEFAWPEHVALVVGSEAHGLSPDVQDGVQGWVHIPMRAGVESLNAAVAVGIVLYSATASRTSANPERYR